MSGEQTFEFKGNVLMYFRVSVGPATLGVSTVKKRGGPAVKTWEIAYSRMAEVRIAERKGASTRQAAMFLKECSGDVVMFGWQKNMAGASVKEAPIYYAAATATLRAIADKRPDLTATIGPYGRSALTGALIGAIVFVVAAYFLVGEVNLTFRVAAAAIIVSYTISALRSGAFAPTRRISLSEAADELAARGQK